MLPKDHPEKEREEEEGDNYSHVPFDLSVSHRAGCAAGLLAVAWFQQGLQREHARIASPLIKTTEHPPLVPPVSDGGSVSTACASASQ